MESVFMDEARMLAAQCWCDPETEDRVMDPALCEAVARRIAAWMLAHAQESRNMAYYRGLLDECAQHLGRQAYTADDGGIHDSPLRAKIPDLVAIVVNSSSSWSRD